MERMVLSAIQSLASGLVQIQQDWIERSISNSGFGQTFGGL
jgi:hypothetical protein